MRWSAALARLDCDVERLEDESDRLANFARLQSTIEKVYCELLSE